MANNFEFPEVQKINNELAFNKKEVERYQKLGSIYMTSKKSSNRLTIIHSDEDVSVLFGNRRFTLNNADLVMLANYNGLFDNGGVD